MNKTYLKKMFVIFAVAFVMTGCASLNNLMGNFNHINNISIAANVDSNQKLPTQIDFVFIYDDEIVTHLGGLTSLQWFAQKSAYQLQFPQSVEIVSLDIVPNSPIVKVTLPNDYQGAKMILLFANYLSTAGQYNTELTSYDEPLILLEADNYQVKELKDK